MKNNIYLYILILTSFFTNAQIIQYKLKGKIVDENNTPIEFVTVEGIQSNVLTQSNGDGEFELFLKNDNESINFTFIGFQNKVETVTLNKDKTTFLTVKLKEEKQQLGEINIKAQSAVEKTRKSAYTVNAVEIKTLASTVSDVNQILNKSAGVRVREEGGLGSNFNFALNGFSGNQIKFYLDGVPLDGVGSSFQLNNIPVNMIERIEIYKGVVPISLGGDALGGALNIITKNSKKKFIDASVSYGSFNTVRSSINMGITTDKGFRTQLNAYQNYSDNDYKVNVDVHDFDTGVLTPKRVKRFHDRYHNEGVILKAGMVNKWYADELLLGITLGKNYKQIQTGNRMDDVYGGRFTKGDLILPSLTYSKRDFLIDNLNVSLNGNYNLGSEQSIDTLNRLYNWDGDYIIKNKIKKEGGEIERRRYKYKNNNGTFVTNASYVVTDNHSFSLNYNLSTFNRKGEDLLDSSLKNNNLPKKSNKSILGLNYQYTYDNRWNTILFFKKYFQYNNSERYYNEEYIKQNNKQNFTGYGIASSYNIFNDLQIKGSFEHSIRMPEAYEMFGDEVNLASNYNLKPESSDNFNIGLQYSFDIYEVNHFSVETNFLYRKATDYIKEEVYTGRGTAAQRVNTNVPGVLVKSYDGEIKYAYKDFFTLMANFTYQDILNNIKYEDNSIEVSPLYRERVANIPYLYGNGMMSFLFKNVFGERNNLRLDYNIMYVHEYYLYAPSVGIAKFKRNIPEQVSQDISLHYALQDGKYNIGLEMRNLANKTLYDNFSLQKPSRSITLKLRYNL